MRCDGEGVDCLAAPQEAMHFAVPIVHTAVFVVPLQEQVLLG